MKKGRLILILGLALFSFMLLSLLMMSLSLKDSEQFGGLFNYLLAFNSFGILLLIILIVLNFRRLARELKHRVAGAVMTLRMVLLFLFTVCGSGTCPLLFFPGFPAARYR